MSERKAVRSTLSISQSIAYYLEMSSPGVYPPGDRAKTIRTVNDILQGRSDRSVDNLMDEVRAKGGPYYAGEISRVCDEIQAFQEQKALLSKPYTKTSGKQYKYSFMDLDPDQPLKIINQLTYDRAAKAGFPKGFFQESYFDQVTFYCLPDNANCKFSRFHNCTFAVCRLAGVRFWEASLYGCAFHSCRIAYTLFPDATLANTHFRDCSIHSAAFLRSRMSRCNTIDCAVGRLNFNGATLDSCSYGRITRLPNSRIEVLETASFTMGGATQEEVQANRTAILQALGVPEPPEKKRRSRSRER